MKNIAYGLVTIAVAGIVLSGCAQNSAQRGTPILSAKSTGNYQEISACLFEKLEQRARSGKLVCNPRINDVVARKKASLWCEQNIGMISEYKIFGFQNDVVQQKSMVTVSSFAKLGLYGNQSVVDQHKEFWDGCVPKPWQQLIE
jgi:hypothetical protein